MNRRLRIMKEKEVFLKIVFKQHCPTPDTHTKIPTPSTPSKLPTRNMHSKPNFFGSVFRSNSQLIYWNYWEIVQKQYQFDTLTRVSLFRSPNRNCFLPTFEFIRPKTHIPALFCQVQFSTSIKFVFKLEIWNNHRNFTKPYNETAFQTQNMSESLNQIFSLICFLAHRSATRVISRETRFRLEIV